VAAPAHEQPPNGERRVTPESTFFDALDSAHLGLERSGCGLLLSVQTAHNGVG